MTWNESDILYRIPTLDGSFGGGWVITLSDDLFRCRGCEQIVDKDQKNQITVSKWSTKATAKAALCDKCFTQFVNSVGFKFGEWKEWPKRSKE